MRRTYAEYRERLRGEQLPLAFVDVELLMANAASLVARANGRPIRLASKSIRCREVLRRVMASNPLFQGVLCFAADEAAHLAGDGFKDLVVAYPTVDPFGLAAVCKRIAEGAQICLMIDEAGHLPPIAAAAAEHGVEVPVAIDLDMSTRFPGLHFGVRRSPVWDVEGAVGLAEIVRRTPRVRLDGVMGYEAQIAGLRDRTPGQTVKSVAVRALKRRSDRELRARRAAIVAALRERGHVLRFVNGGGTGSVESTRDDTSVTEIAAGSGLYGPVLFEGYDNFKILPAAGFALPVVRRPIAGTYTCYAGGWIASGSAGPDRLPRPYLPEDARLLPTEGAGEVQTPVTCEAVLSLGDPVFFRHAKAGELCEHVRELVLLEGDGGRARVPTYRGDGFCFA